MLAVPNSIKFICIGSGITAGCGIWQIPGLKASDELIAIDEESDAGSVLTSPLTPIVKGKPVAKVFGFHGNTHNSHFQSTYGCYDNFFGESAMKNGNILVKRESSENVTEIAAPKDKGQADPIGCTLIQFSYNLKGPQWGFKSEVTLKNEKTGMAMWIVGGSRKYLIGRTGRTIYTQNLHYRVAFLEKGSDEKWEVKGGYQWNDASVAGRIFAITVIDPAGNKWLSDKDIDYKVENHKLREGTPTLKEYSGVWEVDNKDSKNTDPLKGGAQIFERNVASSELLGRQANFSQCVGACNAMEWEGYKQTQIKYDTESQQWVFVKSRDKWLDISKTLDEWYEPFRKAQGKWKSIDDYCKANEEKCTSVAAPKKQAK